MSAVAMADFEATQSDPVRREETPAAPRSRAGRELIREGRMLLASLDGLVSTVTLPIPCGLADMSEALADAASTLSEHLLADGAQPLRPLETIRVLSQLQELRLEIAGCRTRRALGRQREVTAAVRELRGATTLEQLFRLLPARLTDCGFTRAWISAVDGDSWRLTGAHPVCAELSRQLNRPEHQHMTPLRPGSAEAEVLRRRRPALIGNAATQQTVNPLIEETFASRSYVVAPLLLETRVVAFLHADRPGSELALDEDDRDLLTLFAEAAGQAFQRVILAERLERIRVDAVAASRSLEELIEDRCSERLTLSTHEAGTDSSNAGVARSQAGAVSAALSHAGAERLAGVLTAREIEVLKLMATGETNASIARELVISEGTVKSHVKNVLRKLHVANRAQAVSRYFRLVRSTDAV